MSLQQQNNPKKRYKMFEKLNRINKLAKALKESGMARDMEEAVKTATEMVGHGEKSIMEISRQPPGAEELVKGEFRVGAKERIKHGLEEVEEALHIRKKEERPAEKPKEEAEELVEEAGEEEKQARLRRIRNEINEIKGHIKKAEENHNSERIDKLKEEIEKLKQEIKKVEEE
jgi:hypothetical protein